MAVDEHDHETGASTAGPATAVQVPTVGRSSRRADYRRWMVAGAFLAPAIVLLGALVVYPVFFGFVRSLFSRSGADFVGLAHYQDVFTDPRTLTMLRNNLIWVVFAPTIVTSLGLIFAVLSERVKWSTAFKVIIFMPMAISMLAAGVIFRLAYEGNPDRGLANAITRGVADVFRGPGAYPGAQPSVPEQLQATGGAFTTATTYQAGETANLGLIAISPQLIPEDAQPATSPGAEPGTIAGTVWLDFTPGTGGERGRVDQGEQGLPGVAVQAVSDGRVVASARTEADGSYVLEGLEDGAYEIRLAADTFRAPFGGVPWLGPTLITPSIIVSYIWMWTGFAMVIIGAGLAAINREVLEAARVDGATEWQVFRRIMVPLLSPVLLVVLVTLVINVLKIFDLVVVIAPGSVQADANVIAVEMWRVAFGGQRNHGLGSALAIILFLLVLPAMAFNIKRFKAE